MSNLPSYIACVRENFDLRVLDKFLTAVPTAELVPYSETCTKSDDEEMGLTYQESSLRSRLCKVSKLGPYEIWEKLLGEWQDIMIPRAVFKKARTFFHFYSINRHKMKHLSRLRRVPCGAVQP